MSQDNRYFLDSGVFPTPVRVFLEEIGYLVDNEGAKNTYLALSLSVYLLLLSIYHHVHRPY